MGQHESWLRCSHVARIGEGVVGVVHACVRGIRPAACASLLYCVFYIDSPECYRSHWVRSYSSLFIFVVGMDNNTWKQVGMERTTTNRLVPFQPFQPGRNKLRHALTVWTLFPLPNFSGRVETLGIYSILATNQQQFVLCGDHKIFVPFQAFQAV